MKSIILCSKISPLGAKATGGMTLLAHPSLI